MAVDVFKLEQERVLAAKIETSTGVFEALTGTEAAFIVYDPSLNGDFPVNDRPLEGNLGQNTAVTGSPTGSITFGIDLCGKGASGLPLWASTFLPACGLTASGTTYTFTGNAGTQPTLSFGMYEDGALRTLIGSVGTFEVKGKAGGIPRINFTFQGKYLDGADTAILAPSFPTVLPPAVAGSLITIGGYTPRINEFTIAAGNQIEYRPDITIDGGLRAAAITGRNSTFAIDPEQDTLANRDWDSIRRLCTLEAFSLTLGGTANNTIVIAGGSAQTLQCPRGVRNGILTRQVSGRFVGASPFSIAFG